MSKKKILRFSIIFIVILSFVLINSSISKEKKEIVQNDIQKLGGTITKSMSLYAGGTSYFKSSTGPITSCHSENTSYVNAFVSGGECIIRGIASSDKEIIVVAKDNINQYTLKILVSKRPGSNDGFEYNNSNIIIAGGLNVDGSYTDYYDKNTVMSQMCTTYDIVNEKSDEDYGNEIYVSAYSATEACGSTSLKYAAICLDPSKAGPTNSNSGAVSTYKISSEIDSESLLGKVTSYVNSEVVALAGGADSFVNNATSEWRIASTIAIRVIDIFESGGSFSTADDANLHSHYYSYVEMANLQFDNVYKKITLGKTVNSPTIQSKIEQILTESLCSETILDKKTAWEGCKTFGNNNSKNTIERVVESTEVKWDANLSNYDIYYKGYVILPASVTGNATFSPNCSNGFSCSNSTFTLAETLSDGRKKYKFEVIIKGSVNATLPVTDIDRKNISIAITAQGLNPLSDAYILKPTNGTNRQRLILLNTASPIVYLYFNGTPNCNLDSPALNYNNCTSESNCSQFKPELFMKAGCCELIPNKESYAYKTACSANSCIYSTFKNVCDYNTPTDGGKYVIQEGVTTNGQKNYSKCVIDVTRSDSVTKLDAAGNSLMVAEYESNQYCNISCKEDWEFSLGSFGAFTGQNAIAAGTYFTLRDPLVVTGSRTCFTSYIDYQSYLTELTNHSHNIVDAYNEYVTAVANRAAIKTVADSSEKGEMVIQTQGEFSTTEDNYCTSIISWDETISPKKVTSGTSACECHCEHYQNNDSSNYGEKKAYDECYSECTGWSDEEKLKNIAVSCPGIKAAVKETRYACDQNTIETCTNFTFKTSTIKFTKYGYDASSEDSESDVDISIDTKSDSPTSGISISGLTKFEPGKLTGYSTSEDGIIGSCSSETVFSSGIDATTITDYVYSQAGTGYDSTIKSSQSTMISQTQQIKLKNEEMFACQHWQLYNEADEGNNKKTQNDILGATLMGATETNDVWKRQYYTIKSSFDPQISYLYEEEEYMSMIGSNNVLVEDTKRNDIGANCGSDGCFDSTKSVDKSKNTNLSHEKTKNTCFSYALLKSDGTPTGEDIEICHNNLDTWYYDTEKNGETTPWTADSLEGKTYSKSGNTSMVEGTHTIALCSITSDGIYASGKDGSIVIKPASDNRFHGGKCSNHSTTYVKANYIKQTIKDGSIYKITGQWYSKDGIDSKSFSSDGTKEKAMQMIDDNDKSPENKSYWSPIGTFATFPIKISTRRNLYQYMFAFRNIGSFSTGALGRIMGSTSSIIDVSSTTCFYEVKEELCICCGEPIDSSIEKYSGVNTTEYIKENGIDYKESNYTNISKKASLGFYISNISLNDIDTDKNRVLADNWKVTKYMINGYTNHTSSKGEELAKDIKAVGENIYNITPEYAFNLTPTAMSEIRGYNEQYGYEVDLKTLTPYGLVSTEPLNNCYDDVNKCDWGLNDLAKYENGENISFIHYGSKFLEGELKNRNIDMSEHWKYDNNILKSNKVCAISEENYRKNVGKSNTKTALSDMVDSGCRWIDYIDSDYDEITNANQYYRLAFK